MMKINLNNSSDKKLNSESNLLKTNDNEINKENDDYNYPKRENIINDLKQKGFNELQIDDILETFKRNSVSNRYPLIKEGNYIRILDNHSIDNYARSNIRKNKRIDDKNSNSKYKNSFVIKTENNKNPEINKNKPKYNCAKLYVNASSEKYRKGLLYRENKYKNNIKIENLRRNIANDIIIPSKNSISNRAYSRKINNKVGNYLNKFKLSYRNSINDIEERKNEMLKKYECDDNYNNYNFKIIFETKNSRNSANNIGYLDIKNMKNINKRESYYKSRNEKKEENKNNNSISITDCNNDFICKNNNTINDKNELISYDLKELKEEKEEEEENNQIKEIKVNLNKNLIMHYNKNIEFDKKTFIKNKRKIYTQRRKEFKTFDEINKEKKSLKENFNNYYKNKFERKLFSDINNSNQKENQINNNYQQNNILVIRKQNTEEEEESAQRNTSISIIKQDSIKNSIPIIESKSCRKNNHIIKLEKSIKSKSLSKISEKNTSKHNHNFVCINLCKNKVKNCSTFYANRGLSIEEKEKSETSLEEINSSNEKKETSNISINDLSKSINSSNKESNQENINHFNKKTNITKIIRLNKAPIRNLNTKTNNYIKLSNNNTKPKNISFNYVTKKYPNGTYKGYILNDKREKTGVMIFDNGAKYEGQWKNDKKNGKGVFTSPHYYDCENFVGMKYEGEFRDDKFDGFGITTYTNGDRYEGEWKNNKQYGSGTVTYFNGDKYEGEWNEGMFDGIGTFFLKNGERFEGRFKNNKYNGYGKYFYLNGNWLEGIFKNDHPSGNCLLHKKDGSVVNVTH